MPNMNFNKFSRTALVAGATFGADPGLVTVAKALVIPGAGASSRFPFHSKWADAFKKAVGAGLYYKSIDSGGAARQITARAVAFGATAAPLLKDGALWAEVQDRLGASGLSLSYVQQPPLYTISIVTHNNKPSARVLNRMAIMYLDELIEFDDTPRIFTSPTQQRTQNYITGRFG